MIMNQTQPRLSSQPYHEGKSTQSTQTALRSFDANSRIPHPTPETSEIQGLA